MTEPTTGIKLSVTKRMTIRKRVSSACMTCKKGKMKCDDQRPCTRCVRFGKEQLCVETSESQILQNSPNPANLHEHTNVITLSQQKASSDALTREQTSFQPGHNGSFPSPQLQLLCADRMLPTGVDFEARFESSDTYRPLHSASAPNITLPYTNEPVNIFDFVPSGIINIQSATAQAVLMEQLIARQRQEIIATIARMTPAYPSRFTSSQQPLGPLPPLSALHGVHIAASASASATGYGAATPHLARLHLPFASPPAVFRP